MSDSRPAGHGSIHWTTATLSPVLDECDRLRAENEELRRLLANATDPQNAGDWDEAREVGWAYVSDDSQQPEGQR